MFIKAIDEPKIVIMLMIHAAVSRTPVMLATRLMRSSLRSIAKLSSYWNLFATDIFDFSSFSLLLLSQCHIVTIVTTIVGILNFYEMF